MSSEYKYFAFISYNSQDLKWGKRLQRKLERYKMSSKLCSEHGFERKPLKPIFFAPTDIQLGDLSDELKHRLRSSRHLIVVCSPHSAQSEWVGKEIEYFYSLGRGKNIHFFIVDGIPNSGNPATECFNPVVKKLGLDGVLGANVNEHNHRFSYLNRERAYIQLITTLLGVEFDTIWRRHQRQMVERGVTYVACTICVVTAIVWAWQANKPVDVQLQLREVTTLNHNLPPMGDATITVHLDNDIIHKSIHSGDTKLTIANIPKGQLDKKVRITFEAEGYYPIDTYVTLDEHISIDIKRDSIPYGSVRFQLVDQQAKPIRQCKVSIAGIESTSDDEGYVDMFIPLSRQAERYHIECERTLERDSLSMPCSTSTIVMCK